MPPIDPPPPVASHVGSFRPGDFNQDIYTIPIEIGLIASINAFYSPRSQTLLPWYAGQVDLVTRPTKYTRGLLLPYTITTSFLVLAGLDIYQPRFHFWNETRGLAHALLLAEIANASAKTIVQEKRPNYNYELSKNGIESPDSRASFYSGHANQAFALSTYTSLLMFEYCDSKVVSTVYSILATSAAGVVSYSRLQDHAHHMTDVFIGAILGSTISWLTFNRVQEVEKENNKISQENNFQFHITPGYTRDDDGHSWYTADLKLEL